MVIDKEEVFIIDYLKDMDKKIIYAPLRTCLLLVENKSVDNLINQHESSERGEILKKIKSKNLVDIKALHESMKKTTPDLAISITNDCNLNCIYCHADAGSVKNHDSMTTEKIEQIVTFYFDYVRSNYTDYDKVQISFMGGGEPMIKPDLLSFAIQTIKNKADKFGIQPIITTATNGAFSKKMADFIIKEFSHISLSFDGPELIQNYHRPFTNGKGSFSQVFKTAKYFQETGFSYAIRATISKLSITHYKEIIDFFYNEFPEAFIGLEPLNPLGRGSNCTSAPSPAEFAEGMTQITKYAEEKGLKVRNANLGKFYLLRTIFCNAIAAPSILVTPNGEIWACTRDNAPDVFRYGMFDFENNKATIDEARLANLRELNVFNFDECSECFCKYHCAGDCPDNRVSGNLRCDATRKIGVQIINQLLDNNIPKSIFEKEVIT